MPAFQDMDDDDGPEFEYLEEPDFDDEEVDGSAQIEQEPPDEALTGLGGTGPAGGGAAAGGGRGGRNRATGNGPPVGSPAAGAIGAAQASPPQPAKPATPRPRPKIVSARAQLREEEERGGAGQGRRRGREEGVCGGGGGGGVADIEGDFGAGRTRAERSSEEGGGLEFPRRKRGRSSNHLGDQGK